jgi:lipopolysaccharide transport system permease protein
MRSANPAPETAQILLAKTVPNPPTSKAAAAPPEIVLQAGRMEAHYWKDLWHYRELLGFLAWRDVKVRYQQTFLGMAWAVVQPLATVIIFWFVFGRMARMPSSTSSYFIVVMAGQLAWQLFANTLGNTSASLIGSAQLITKVYFPRLIVPLSTVLVAFVDFLVVLVLYAVTALWTRTAPGIQVLWLPCFIALALLLALGLGLWLAALTVRYRDFRILVPFLLQIGIFATPVGYQTNFLTTWREVLALNPMTGVIDAFRWSLLGSVDHFAWYSFSFSVVWAAVLLSSGVWYFRRTERTFADVI